MLMRESRLYATVNDLRFDVYSYYKNLGYSMDFIVDKMESKINEIGPSNVSSHCGNASLADVFDVTPLSVSNVEGFMDCAENNTSINDFLSPRDGDPAFHF
jgi:hypothetical protein